MNKNNIKQADNSIDNYKVLAIAATFVADPIQEYVAWWSEKFGYKIKINFAPYNQVFQSLLDPDSIICKNTDLNLMLVRFEDWIRDLEASEEEKLEAIENNYKKLTEIIKTKETPCITGVFPVSTSLGLSEQIIKYIKELNKRWIKDLKDLKNVTVLDFNEAAELYSIQEIFDPITDKEGHIPFTDEYYAAAGTLIARKIVSIMSNPFKVIALDCDNTLWKGICGEDGALGVVIDEPYLELQKYIIQKHDEGMLIVLCSKNNEADVWEVFDNNPNMLLKKHHLTAWQINWEPKSGNLLQLAAELNLGIDSFIFIDDSLVECHEVTQNRPEVLTIQLPENIKQLPYYLKHIWAFDKEKITEEDRVRTKSYQTEKLRKEIQSSSKTLEDFLKELSPKIYINEINNETLMRVSQLTQRTNQFNLSTIRRTEDDLLELISHSDTKCWTIQVLDKFGEYGLTGAVIMKEMDDSIFIDTFLLSCRVLGRRIEDAILVELGKYCRENGFKKIKAVFIPTNKNQQVKAYLEKNNFYIVEERSNSTLYEINTADIEHELSFIECYYGVQPVKLNKTADNNALACELDHIGVEVSDLEAIKQYYNKIEYSCTDTVFDPLQNAYLSLCSRKEFDTIELVNFHENKRISKGVDIKLNKPYHICYRVKDFNEFISSLDENQISWEIIKEPTPAVLFDYKEVMFIFVKGMGVFELIQDKDFDFNSNENTYKLNTIRLIVTDKDNAIKFYNMLGYIEEDRHFDNVKKVLTITYSKRNSSKIELLINMDVNTIDDSPYTLGSLYINQICYKCDGIEPFEGMIKENSRNSPYSTLSNRYDDFANVAFALKSEFMPYSIYYLSKEDKKSQLEYGWEINIQSQEQMLHFKYLLPLKYYSGSMLLKLPIYEISEAIINKAIYEAPNNETEEVLIKIWEEVLKISGIGINDNFFELGGHSLKAAVIASKIFKRLGVQVSISKILSLPKIKALSKYINNSNKETFFTINHVSDSNFYPAAPAQKRIMLLDKIEDTSTSYNIPILLSINGNVDLDKLEKSLNTIVMKYEILRTAFEIKDGHAIQVVHNDNYIKLQHLENASKDIEVIMQNFIKPFKLNKLPLLRLGVIKADEHKFLLAFDIHHIIADGISVELLIKELFDIYHSKTTSLPILQYRDYAVWHHNLLQNNVLDAKEKYWVELLKGEIPTLNLPLDFSRPAKQSFEGDRVYFKADKELAAQLKSISFSKGATLYITLLSLYYILLSKYSEQEDVIIATPVSGRMHANIEEMIGMFVNTIILRNKPCGEKSFEEFLIEVKKHAFEAYDNQEYQFELLIDKLKLNRDLSRNPLFDVMFNMLNADRLNFQVEEMSINQINFRNSISKFDLTLEVFENDEELIFSFEYCTKLFKRETIERFAANYINLANNVINNTDKRIADIEIYTQSEKKQLLFEFNNTYKQYSKEKTIHQLFEEQVSKTPYNIAIQFYDTKLTYTELNEKSNRLAVKLRELGVKQNSIIGILVKRRPEMLIAMLGILKAGGAYLPLDPDYPIDRIKYMFEDSGSKILVSQSEFIETNTFEQADLFDIDSIDSLNSCPVNLENINKPDDLAYVIYTSGSTGKPKGVMIEHRTVNNFIIGMTDKIDFPKQGTILALTTISFDIFVLETFLPLSKGMKIVIADEKQQKDSKLLCDLIVKSEVEVLQITPSRMQLLKEGGVNFSRLDKVKVLLLGGEPLPESIYNEVRSKLTARIFNVYGPTETTVWSTVKEMTDKEKVTIGKPIANTRIYIINKYNKLQPIGAIGELCIAGDGLARGYLNKPELTNERFIPEYCDEIYKAFHEQRMYRTGDLARWLSDGELEHLGRVDHQVKVRGHRIELGEIESSMSSCKNIKDSVVVVKTNPETNSQYLAGYYISEAEITVSEIRNHLLKHLPAYMIPEAFVQLKEFPQTPNGKTDRNALPEPDYSRPKLEVEFRDAETLLEKKLVDIWKYILKRDAIGINDSFFELGGNSMLLVALSERLEKEYPGKVSVSDLFNYSTISKLAAYLEAEEQNDWRNIDMCPLLLPKEYFICNNEIIDNYSVLKFDIPMTIHEKVKASAYNCSVEVFDILLAMYIYLLGEISQRNEVTVHALLPNKESIRPIKIDLSQLTDIPMFYKQVSEKINNTNTDDTYPIKNIDRIIIERDESAIIPFMGNKHHLEDVTLNAYDVAFKVSEDIEKVEITCEYNFRRLRKDKVEGIIYGFLKLIEL